VPARHETDNPVFVGICRQKRESSGVSDELQLIACHLDPVDDGPERLLVGRDCGLLEASLQGGGRRPVLLMGRGCERRRRDTFRLGVARPG